MNNILALSQSSQIYIIFGLAAFCVILFIFNIVSLVKISNIKKRIDNFMKPKDKEQDLESMIIDYLEEVKKVNSEQDYLLKEINNINSRLKYCVQKIGIIRYNPFDNVGGDLCFAVAILDENNDGIVLNSIYSREGCYTYAKSIVNGQCEKHKLSSEEELAIKEAINSNR